jgi:hypothetical protein
MNRNRMGREQRGEVDEVWRNKERKKRRGRQGGHLF